MNFYNLNKLKKLSKKQKIQIVIGSRCRGKFPFAPNEPNEDEEEI